MATHITALTIPITYLLEPAQITNITTAENCYSFRFVQWNPIDEGQKSYHVILHIRDRKVIICHTQHQQNQKNVPSIHPSQ